MQTTDPVATLPTMSAQPKRWEKIRGRFKALRAATDWPEEVNRIELPEARATRLAMEHEANWGKVFKHHELVHRFGGTIQLQKAIELVALKATYELALTTGALTSGRLLAALPLNKGDGPANWALPVKHASFPATLTLNPLCCSPEVFQEAVAAVERQVAPEAMSQQAGVLDWLMSHLHAWPEPADLLQIEGEIVEDACRMLSRTTRARTFDHLVNTYEFSQRVAKHIMNLCEAPLRQLGKVDKDLERGLLLVRTEEFYRRARREHDLKAEGTALKIHATLAGLTQPEPKKEQQTEGDDWLTAINRVNAEQVRPQAALPGPGPGRDISVPNNSEDEESEDDDA